MDWELIRNLSNPQGSTIQCYKFLYGFVSLIKPKIVVETGTNTGVSAIVMAMAMRDNCNNGKIFTVDIEQVAIDQATKQINELELYEYITLICSDSTKFLRGLIHREIDLVFLDGEHTTSKLEEDVQLVRSRCKYILFHDLQIPEVKKFLSDKSCFMIDYGGTGQQYHNGSVVYESFPGFGLMKGELKI